MNLAVAPAAISLLFAIVACSDDPSLGDSGSNPVGDPEQSQQHSPQHSDEQPVAAASNYQQYCALCHGEQRQGYVNDHAPSLRSKSLMAAAMPQVMLTTAYGRFGTPMAGYLDEIGGPLSWREIGEMTAWLQQQAAAEPVRFAWDPVAGDPVKGEEIYQRDCSECHGANGEGGVGTALGNAAMLSTTPDEFLRYAIVNGRDGTEMAAFADRLSAEEIDSVTAFLRSRAAGWAIKKPVLRSPPPPEQYVLNPDAPHVDFALTDGLYVKAADLLEALEQGRRMVLLDTRALSMWQMVNIEGSVPLPYYQKSLDLLAADLPKDGTMIVTYCECPRAAAESVNGRLREAGFENTAVLWEGIGGWVSLGYPVSRGETVLVDALASEPTR